MQNYKKRYPAEYYNNSSKIYYLSYNNIPFYVGVTRLPLIKRLSDSRKDSKKNNSPKDLFMRDKAKDIEIHLLETVDIENHSLFLEEFWIQLLKSWGFNLLNIYKVKPAKRMQTRDLTRYRQFGILTKTHTPKLCNRAQHLQP